MTRSKSENPSINKCGRFLSDYSSLLYRSGATCIRLDKNLQRMAEKWGYGISMTVMPRQITLILTGRDNESRTFTTSIGKCVNSYDIITRLSKLSWEVADTAMTLDEASERMQQISRSSGSSRLWVLFAASAANSAFCRLFGGDTTAMAIVFIATLAGFYLKQLMTASHIDQRIVFVICAFASSVLAAAGYLFSLGATPDVAIATSVLYLVPGIPFLNAFSDLTDGHYVSFICRLTDAGVLTCCLSVGLCIGMKLMNVGMF